MDRDKIPEDITRRLDRGNLHVDLLKLTGKYPRLTTEDRTQCYKRALEHIREGIHYGIKKE